MSSAVMGGRLALPSSLLSQFAGPDAPMFPAAVAQAGGRRDVSQRLESRFGEATTAR
jgi:hypothetical protein